MRRDMKDFESRTEKLVMKAMETYYYLQNIKKEHRKQDRIRKIKEL